MPIANYRDIEPWLRAIRDASVRRCIRLCANGPGREFWAQPHRNLGLDKVSASQREEHKTRSRLYADWESGLVETTTPLHFHYHQTPILDQEVRRSGSWPRPAALRLEEGISLIVNVDMREHFVIDPLIGKRQQLLLATQLCRMVLKVGPPLLPLYD